MRLLNEVFFVFCFSFDSDLSKVFKPLDAQAMPIFSKLLLLCQGLFFALWVYFGHVSKPQTLIKMSSI